MAASKPLLLEAVDHALAGDWQRAHEIAQDHEDDPIADWIHGVVHDLCIHIPPDQKTPCLRRPREVPPALAR
jgi:hypothetical protein